MNPYEFNYNPVQCIAQSPKAILVKWSCGQSWIPQSQVHENSEVYKKGDSGRLIVSEWFAEKQGWDK